MSSPAFHRLEQFARQCGLLIGNNRDPAESPIDGIKALIIGIGNQRAMKKKWPEDDIISAIIELPEQEWELIRGLCNRFFRSI